MTSSKDLMRDASKPEATQPQGELPQPLYEPVAQPHQQQGSERRAAELNVAPVLSTQVERFLQVCTSCLHYLSLHHASHYCFAQLCCAKLSVMYISSTTQRSNQQSDISPLQMQMSILLFL